jgi:hypothetical protein
MHCTSKIKGLKMWAYIGHNANPLLANAALLLKMSKIGRVVEFV